MLQESKCKKKSIQYFDFGVSGLMINVTEIKSVTVVSIRYLANPKDISGGIVLLK